MAVFKKASKVHSSWMEKFLMQEGATQAALTALATCSLSPLVWDNQIQISPKMLGMAIVMEPALALCLMSVHQQQIERKEKSAGRSGNWTQDQAPTAAL